MTWQIQAALLLAQKGVGFRQITSPLTDSYNCIAWAAGDDTRWWWPSGRGYWPGRPRRQDFLPTLEVFREAFGRLGYVHSENGILEQGFEKVALYARAGAITHAARQLPTGHWTSKLGNCWDIEHELDHVVGEYGQVIAFLKRRTQPP